MVADGLGEPFGVLIRDLAHDLYGFERKSACDLGQLHRRMFDPFQQVLLCNLNHDCFFFHQVQHGILGFTKGISLVHLLHRGSRDKQGIDKHQRTRK